MGAHLTIGILVLFLGLNDVLAQSADYGEITPSPTPSASASPVASPVASPTPFVSRILNPVLENKTPLGLSTFAMGVKNKFPLWDQQVPRGVGYMSVATTVRHIATNELYTFPEKPSRKQIISTLKTFIDSGHKVTHEIHVLSGPGMRHCRDRWINKVMGRPVCAHQFVHLLKTDKTIRRQVRALFFEVVEYAKILESIGVRVWICPELEDNQNDQTFQILLNQLEKAGWSDKRKIIRNGPNAEVFGVRSESHARDSNAVQRLRKGDIYNADGNTFYFDTDTEHPSGANSESFTRSLRDEAQEKGVIFFLWSDRLQGLYQSEPGIATQYPSYYCRYYELLKPVQQAAILLGLTKEEILVARGSPDPNPSLEPGKTCAE